LKTRPRTLLAWLTLLLVLASLEPTLAHAQDTCSEPLFGRDFLSLRVYGASQSPGDFAGDLTESGVCGVSPFLGGAVGRRGASATARRLKRAPASG